MKHKPLILTSLLLAAFVINVDTTIVNVALPTLVRELHASNSQLQWVVDAYNLLFAGIGAGRRQPLGPVRAQGHAAGRARRLRPGQPGRRAHRQPRAADRRARRDGRGLGDGVPLDPVAHLQRVHASGGERARAIGLWGAITGAAIALGPIVGGWLLQLFDWRSIFFAMTPVAALAGVLVARYVPTSRDPHAPARRPARVRALHRHRRAARLHHHRGAEPRLGERADARRLRCHRRAGCRVRRLGAARASTRCSTSACSATSRFTAASASVAISFFALSGFIFLVTQYFQFLKGYGPLSTGVRLLPVASFVAIASILGAKLAVRVGTKLIVAVGPAR